MTSSQDFERALREAQGAEEQSLKPKREQLTALVAQIAETEKEAAEIAQALKKASHGGVVEKNLEASTFHRAFDMTRDPYEALEDLVALGIDRVLTSGQENSVLEGLDLITDLVQRAGERIIVMPGGGITERNIKKIIAQSGAREAHIVGTVTVTSPMRYRNPRPVMGGELRPPEFSRALTDADRIREFVRAVR